MTDPTQTTNPQNQGQQPVTDDIFGGSEDVFANTHMFTPLDINEGDEPEIVDNENDLPYGDVLEQKYHFDPIPEEISSDILENNQSNQSSQEIDQSVIQKSPIQVSKVDIDIDEEREEEVEMRDEQDVSQNQEGDDFDEQLPTKFQTDMQKKFGELFMTTKKVYTLKNSSEEDIEIVGANNDKVFISYKFLIDQDQNPGVYIIKHEQNKQTDEEIENELKFIFNEAGQSLNIIVNETLLFDEVEDLTVDSKKKLQVVDKLNKFIFLISEELRKIEKEIKEKEEAERERKRLQEIFRNF